MNDIPLLEIKNLSHRFGGGKTAVDDVSLIVENGSFTVIGGENGSGKTVLMKHLNGILKPTGGDVLVNGIPVSKNSLEARKKIGLVFQNSDTQLVAQTVREDIAFGPENLGLPADEIRNRVDKAGEEMDLTALLDKPPHRLSGGEKKKTAIAGVLAMSPDLIVFDEPFAGLDFRGVRMLLRKMLSLHSRGKAIIVITHDLEKVLAHADRLVLMSNGQKAAEGNPEDLLDEAEKYGLRIPFHRDCRRMSWLDGSE